MDETRNEENVKNNKQEDILLNEAYEMIQQGVFDIKSEMTRELSMHKIESKKEIVAEKEHYIDAIISSVKKRLLGFRKSDDYVKYLVSCIEKSKEKLGGLTRVYVTRTDLETVRLFVTDVEVKQDIRIMLGGLIAENDGLTIDYTFDKKIKNERDKLEEKLAQI